jgi:hypothetical protein
VPWQIKNTRKPIHSLAGPVGSFASDGTPISIEALRTFRIALRTDPTPSTPRLETSPLGSDHLHHDYPQKCQAKSEKGCHFENLVQRMHEAPNVRGNRRADGTLTRMKADAGASG